MQEGSWTLVLNNSKKESCSAWNEVGVGREICVIPEGCKPRKPKEFIFKNPEVDRPATVKFENISFSILIHSYELFISAEWK